MSSSITSDMQEQIDATVDNVWRDYPPDHMGYSEGYIKDFLLKHLTSCVETCLYLAEQSQNTRNTRKKSS